MFTTLLTENLNGEIVTACGSFSTMKLDARNNLETMKQDCELFLQKENKFKNHFVGYAIFKNLRDTKAIFSTHTFKY
jgi:hypothetical protein